MTVGCKVILTCGKCGKVVNRLTRKGTVWLCDRCMAGGHGRR